VKTLIVVSGGDAPGVNTFISHFTSLATTNGDLVVGGVGGFQGVLDGHIVPLKPVLITPWIGQGGSYLQSSRKPVLNAPEAQKNLTELLVNHKIDNLLLLGGDGTQRNLAPLMEAWGITCVGIPTTIDNDVPGTEQTIGFDSACNFAHHTIDGLMATAHSLTGRIYIVETLGGHTGFLALNIALASGAHGVLVPEYEYTGEWLGRRLHEAVKRDNYALLVLSEGVADSRHLAEHIAEWTNTYTRDTRLGHGQRGAIPSHRDRLLAAHMAQTAYTALRNGMKTGTVVVQSGQVMLHQGTLVGQPVPLPDRTSYNFVNGISE
jgi:6-phosphofructokinase 1